MAGPCVLRVSRVLPIALCQFSLAHFVLLDALFHRSTSPRTGSTEAIMAMVSAISWSPIMMGKP